MSENSGQESALNLSYLQDISGGDADFMIEMIDIFLDQTPKYFAHLSEALADKNWPLVAETAHKIKPTLAFMGADAESAEMQFIEKSARVLVNLDELQGRFDAVKAVCTSLYGRLTDYKETLKSGG